MEKVLSYKGHFGTFKYDFDDKILHGKIECINDLVTFERAVSGC